MRFLCGTRAGQSADWVLVAGLVIVVLALLLAGMAAGAAPAPV